MTRANNPPKGHGVYESNITLEEDFALFERLPLELRELLRNAPFKGSASDIKEALDAGHSIQSIIRLANIFFKEKIEADRKPVWNIEDETE